MRKRSNALSLAFVLVSCSLGSRVSALAEDKHIVTLEDLQTIKTMDHVALSPDGMWLAYRISDGDIWIHPARADTASKRVGRGYMPTWSPDSVHLAYYSSASGSDQLWTFNRENGRRERITRMLGGVDPNPATAIIGSEGYGDAPLVVSWSPDGKKLVFASRKLSESQVASSAHSPDAGMPLVLTNTTPPDWTIAGIFANGGTMKLSNGHLVEASPELTHNPNHLFVVDIQTKQLHQLTTDAQDYFTPDWSPDGNSIVSVSTEGRPLAGWGSGPTNLYLIDVHTDRRTALTSDEVFYKTRPKWSPDGKWIAFSREQHGHDRDISVMPATGGDAVSLTDGDHCPQDFYWAADSHQILFVYKNLVTFFLSKVDRETKEVNNLLSDPQVRSLSGVSRNGTIVWYNSSPTHANAIYTMASNSNTPELVVDPNPQIQSWVLGEQEVLQWKNSRGDQLQGVVLYPPDYKPGHRYPLIVEGYPGVGNDFKGFAMWGNHMWAAKGYVLFWPVSRAPHTWMNNDNGEAFDEAVKGPAGLDVMVDDVISGVDELIHRGVVDGNRMCLYGFSNGGASVNDLVTRTDRFRCAVSVSAALSTDWTSLYLAYTDFKIVPELVGVEPWQDPNPWIQLSTVFRLDKIKTPMLIAAGDDEDPLREIELYNGLRALHKGVTFLRYPHQGHGFEGPALKDFTQRVLAFFREHLQ